MPLVSLAAPEVESAEVLRRACLEHGFFYLADHGVPEAVVTEALEQQRRFFALPLDEKMRIKANSDYRCATVGGHAPPGTACIGWATAAAGRGALATQA